MRKHLFWKIIGIVLGLVVISVYFAARNEIKTAFFLAKYDINYEKNRDLLISIVHWKYFPIKDKNSENQEFERNWEPALFALTELVILKNDKIALKAILEESEHMNAGPANDLCFSLRKIQKLNPNIYNSMISKTAKY